MRHSKVQQTYSITTYSSSNECQSEDDKTNLISSGLICVRLPLSVLIYPGLPWPALVCVGLPWSALFCPTTRFCHVPPCSESERHQSLSSPNLSTGQRCPKHAKGLKTQKPKGLSTKSIPFQAFHTAKADQGLL
jgi:hypothetical protein